MNLCSVLLVLALSTAFAQAFPFFNKQPQSQPQSQQQQKQKQQQQQQQHSKHQPRRCTKTLAPADALHPLCFVPDTVSTEAQAFLRQRHVVPGVSWNDKAAGQRAAAAYDDVVRPISAAAAAKFLQDVRNDTLGGVPVTIGTPRGMPQANADKILVYAHGGAYVKGSCYHLWHVTAMAAQLAGVQVLCIDFRLACDAPFPAALDDAMAVYTALLNSRRYKPQNIALIGDSSGGGLALALLLKAKQQLLPLPGAALLMSPWADLTQSGDTQTTLTGIDPFLQYTLNLAQPALTYVNGNKALLQDPFVSPLKASVEAFKGFPPTLLQVGLRDSFLSLSTMLHRKLISAGVESVVSPWEGMWHVFQASLDVPEAQEAQRELAKFLVKHLGLQV